MDLLALPAFVVLEHRPAHQEDGGRDDECDAGKNQRRLPLCHVSREKRVEADRDEDHSEANQTQRDPFKDRACRAPLEIANLRAHDRDKEFFEHVRGRCSAPRHQADEKPHAKRDQGGLHGFLADIVLDGGRGLPCPQSPFIKRSL